MELLNGQAIISIAELDNYRDIEKNFDEKVRKEQKRITKKENELKKMIENLRKGGTVYIKPRINTMYYSSYEFSNDIVTKDEAVKIVIKEVEELKLKVKELEKRPEKCILF